MTVGVDDVRRLLASREPEAALVVIEGRVEVATPSELDSPDYRGALQVATREDVVRGGGGRHGTVGARAGRAGRGT